MVVPLRGAVAFRVAAILLAAIQAWAARHSISSDGVAYLDVGDAFLRRDWSVALNAMWSPLYPWLLALMRGIVEPPLYYEYASVHAFNFAIFLCAMAAFEFFLRRWLANLRLGDDDLRPRAWTALGYALFLWGALGMTGLGPASPDLLCSAIIYWASGLLLEAMRRTAALSTCAALGAVLGLGYWARAPLAWLAVFFLIPLLWRTSRASQRRWKAFGVAAGAFLLTAAPLAVALSAAKGRLTLSDSGTLNYGWYVAGVTYRHWQGEPAGTRSTGQPIHPVRRLLADPPVYEFATPLNCTYPVWCDPSYWYEGLNVQFDLRRQVDAAAANLRLLRGLVLPLRFYQVLFSERSLQTFGLFVALMLFAGLGLRLPRGRLTAGIVVLLPAALGGLALYCLVHLEPRYVAVYLVLAVLSLASFAALPVRMVPWILAAFLFCAAPQHILQFQSARLSMGRPPMEWMVAKAVRAAGIEPGSPIAVLGYANLWHSRWARLARMRIVSEVYGGAFHSDDDLFWTAPANRRRQILDALRGSGAKAVISRNSPPWAMQEGWQPLNSELDHAIFVF